MFEFIRRLLGTTSSADIPTNAMPCAPTLIAAAAVPDTPRWEATPPPPLTGPEPAAVPPARLGSLQIQLGKTADDEATLTALDMAGNVMFRTGQVVVRSSDALARSVGNAGRHPMFRFGDTPTGTYEVVEVLPAYQDTRGIELFGSHRSLRLRPVSGAAALADASGRTALLIHGGPAGRPTDGSIRVPDMCMLKLLARMPPEVGTPGLRVLVEVLPFQTGAAIYGSTTSPQAYSSSYASSGYYDDDSSDTLMWMAYYQQLYLWEMDTSQGQASCLYLDPPTVACDPPAAAWDGARSPADQAASDALAGLGYGVVADGAVTGPIQDPQVGATTPVDVYPPADVSQSPADSGFTPYYPQSSPTDTPASSDAWQPSGGAYGR